MQNKRKAKNHALRQVAVIAVDMDDTYTQTPNNVKGTTAATKKRLLWTVLMLQLCFIGFFWLLQFSFDENAINAGAEVVGEAHRFPTRMHERINFIKKAATTTTSESKATITSQHKAYANSGDDRKSNLSNFEKDYYRKSKRNTRLNNNNTEQVDVGKYEKEIWCYREGSIDEDSNNNNNDYNDYNEYEDAVKPCKCRAGWHGYDCGQPEIIWRALITARRVLPQLTPGREAPHRLVYMLEGSILSLDLMELQLQSVSAAVDFFLIHIRDVTVGTRHRRALQRRVSQLLGNQPYILHYCAAAGNCTTAHAYSQLRAQLPRDVATDNDLFLYTNDEAIVAPQALLYLKRYAAAMPPMRFRLKYLVYGFYWQHPARTQLSGVISSLGQLHDPHVGRADPDHLLRLEQQHTLVIGDLNHYGGWFCQYCQQPEEFIAALHAKHRHSSLATARSVVSFPNATRNRHFDVDHLQRLIAQGLYVDGRTQLTRLRHHAEPYYAPPYAQTHNWRYGHLLVNIYVSMTRDAAGMGMQDEDEDELIY